MGTTKTAPPDYLTADDMAERFRVPLATVRRWRLDSYGPIGIRVGKHVRWRRVDMERWEEQQWEEASRSAEERRRQREAATTTGP